jgi:hypothetical protein
MHSLVPRQSPGRGEYDVGGTRGGTRMSGIWIPLGGVIVVALASFVTGVVSWIKRNPLPKYASDQPPGGWPPPGVVRQVENDLRLESESPHAVGRVTVTH